MTTTRTWSTVGPYDKVDKTTLFLHESDFPAFSWVLSVWLPGCLAGCWLLVSRVCLSVHAINTSMSGFPNALVFCCWQLQQQKTTALEKPDVIAFTSDIQRGFAIRVDSAPSWKLGPRVRVRLIDWLAARRQRCDSLSARPAPDAPINTGLWL